LGGICYSPEDLVTATTTTTTTTTLAPTPATENSSSSESSNTMAKSNGGGMVASDGSTYTSDIEDPCKDGFYDSASDRYFNCNKNVGKYNAAEGGYCPGTYNVGSDNLCYPFNGS
jgi:hypothetical protein